MPYSSLAIANEFLDRARDTGVGLTHMQVQKLVYIAHGWNLGSTHRAFVDEHFEAWAFGPVARKLYDSLKRHGGKSISTPIAWGDDTPLNGEGDLGIAYEQIDDFGRRLIDWVFEAYGRHDAFKLSALTHEPGTPWQKVYVRGQNRVILNEAIEEYFAALIPRESEAA